MCMSVFACICVTMCVPGANGDQKSAFAPMERELQMAINCLVGAGNQTLSPLKKQHVPLTVEPFLQSTMLLIPPFLLYPAQFPSLGGY